MHMLCNACGGASLLCRVYGSLRPSPPPTKPSIWYAYARPKTKGQRGAITHRSHLLSIVSARGGHKHEANMDRSLSS
eukprot:scaffold178221_cov32-Tisochrysis_lutea.AAC.5